MSEPRYSTVQEFWTVTGYLSAICDVCGRTIGRGEGRMLDTADIVGSTWYKEVFVPSMLRKLVPDADDEDMVFMRQVQLMLCDQSKSQWLLCESCYTNLKR